MGLKLKEEIVKFTSTSENFEKEKSGVKCNTVRLVDIEDIRFQGLRDGNYDRIGIFEKETKKYFERAISDVTFWFIGSQEIAIISWRV